MFLVLSDTYRCSVPVGSLSGMPTLVMKQPKRSRIICHHVQRTTRSCVSVCMLNTVPTKSELYELLTLWVYAGDVNPTFINLQQTLDS